LEKRKVTGVSPSDIKVTLNQVFLPLPPQAPTDEAENQKLLAETMRETVDGCKDFEALAKEVKSPLSPTLGTFALTDLSAQIRSAVGTLDIGKASAPVTLPNGLLMLMVCEREQPKVELPGREEVSQQLLDERLGLMARRYLRDVRLAAVVDIRV
jgi:peptidyl-prolyl cis-trans isomerase SurA